MKKNKSNKDSIPSLFAKKYIYYYYAFFLDNLAISCLCWMNKNIILIIIIVLAIELSGHGIIVSLMRLLNSAG